jgi:DNA polymerase III delta prime subunit
VASAHEAGALLERSLASGRIHSAYLISGPGSEPRAQALRFARGSVCRGSGARPCDDCAACRRSAEKEPIALDGSGKSGPLLRHIGDHPDLFFVERGEGDTRVRIGQVRALQHALRLRSSEGGRRAAVIADAEWLNQEAQNALLRLLEEPPPDTTLLLVASSSASLLATVRSRCQRVAFSARRSLDLEAPERAELVARLESIASASLPQILDWAEEFRGGRAESAARVELLLDTASAWIQRRVAERAAARGALRGPLGALRGPLGAFRTLSGCRKALAQRNANPQMVAERALFALHSGLSS